MPSLSPRPGRASLIGSWPGTDVVDAARIVLDELPDPDVPVLPELPDRGPGADLIGRAATFLVDLAVDLQPSGWRLVDRPGRDQARAQAFLREDLDVLAEAADGYAGTIKVAVCGPWTLAASLYLPRLERAVADPGACRDLVASLAEGVNRHVAELRRLLPGAGIVVQLDEPSLPAVLVGALPRASGFGRLGAVEEPVVVAGVATVLAAAQAAGASSTVVHCCAAQPPVDLLARTAAGGLSLDVSLLGRAGWEALAPVVEAGTMLWAGVSATSGPLPTPAAAAGAVWDRWRKLGLAVALLDGVVLTPTCGLAGSTPADARARLSRVRDAAAALAERAEQAR